MSFPKNAWYAAAWGADISRELFARTIINEPLVFYRKENGEVVALSDMCPHRFAPLNKGKLVGDSIECGYHGLHFDGSGGCVFNPHGDGSIPKTAKVRSFPIVEQDTLVWIWMGEAAAADPAKIPDFPWLNDKETYVFTPASTFSMKLDYRLIVDNLLDLSHAAYLHAATLGAAPGTKDITDVRQEGTRIYSDRLIPNSPPAFVFTATGAANPDDLVDYWANMRVDLPCAFYMDAGVTLSGRDKSEGNVLSSVQILTPETDDSSFYLWSAFRNYRKDDEVLTQVIADTIKAAFSLEDEPMMHEVQVRMAGRDFWKMKPILLSGDGAAVLARRITDKMIAEDLEITAASESDKRIPLKEVGQGV
jgi:vanillate O-demethylase monooxygenase subunit